MKKLQMRIAICDDDAYVIETLEQYIEKINSNDNDIFIVYEVFFNAESLIRDCDEELYDAYILDIELGETSGLELAKHIRETNSYSQIVFLTSHSEWVYESFGVTPFDFINKPLNYNKIEMVLSRLSDYIHFSNNYFKFSYNRTQYNIARRNILYVEKMGRKVFIHLIDGQMYECNMPMDKVRGQLNLNEFVSIRKSCILNLDSIMLIEKNIVRLYTGESLLIGREYVNLVKKEHLAFLKKYYM